MNFIRLLYSKMSQTQIIVIGFLFLIFIGSIILNLPIASKNGESIGYLNAFFTATSATCVTGLVVVDTYSHWTLFGQITILFLIQIGGLGFMTVATLFSFVLNRRITYSERMLIAESLNQNSLDGGVKLIKRILIGTFIFETLGSILLSVRFIKQFGLINGIYKGIFHSISAFCNAGFDLMGEIKPYSSLMPYGDDILINITVMFLIIVGGIGFFVWSDILKNFKKGFRSLSLHSKVVIYITSYLLLVGFLLFLFIEFYNPGTIGNLNFIDKILKSFFQSVTTRTAGFNTIDQGSMHDASKFLTIFYMIIGGSPGSTAGGIKTVTFGILLLAAISRVKGRKDFELFERRIPLEVVFDVFSIAMMSFINIVITTMVLSFFENTSFMNVLFESVSAFGTVGLSLGITSGLTKISKIFIIISMFFGRIGVLTFAVALVNKHSKKRKFRLPKGRIMVG